MEKFLPGGKIVMGKIIPGVCLSRSLFLTLHRSEFTFCAKPQNVGIQGRLRKLFVYV